MTTEEFELIVKDWLATAKHPRFKRPYTELVYQPMLELLAYLRANGFKTYIVSGGGIEFMRPWSEKVYGIPPEQVIGSSIKTKYRDPRRQAGAGAAARDRLHRRQGRQARGHSASSSADGRSWPSATPTATSRCCEWTTAGERAALRADRPPHRRRRASTPTTASPPLGRLDKALDEAPKRGWTVVRHEGRLEAGVPVREVMYPSGDVTPCALMERPMKTKLLALVRHQPRGHVDQRAEHCGSASPQPEIAVTAIDILEQDVTKRRKKKKTLPIAG